MNKGLGMFPGGQSPTIRRGLKIAAFIGAAAIGLLHDASADTTQRPPKHATPQTSKCLCGYGISGYEAITCVPVKDCEWEHAVCRGQC
jgi:hypothetical protein